MRVISRRTDDGVEWSVTLQPGCPPAALVSLDSCGGLSTTIFDAPALQRERLYLDQRAGAFFGARGLELDPLAALPALAAHANANAHANAHAGGTAREESSFLSRLSRLNGRDTTSVAALESAVKLAERLVEYSHFCFYIF